MGNYFKIVPIKEGVTHIGDKMHVYATLITGTKSAILFDTTNGIGNLRACVESLTDLPYTVIASHGHGDHTRGNYQFDEVLLHPADFELCREWNSDEWRETSLNNAKKLNIVPDDFDCDAYLAGGTGNIQPLDVEKVYDLGGLTVEIVPMPGHTSGQIGLLIREHRLLLTADACNPMMWMFLKWALSIPEWARMLEKVKELPFDYFLPAHIPDLLPKARMDVQIETARRANMADAVPMKHQPAIEGRPQAYVYSLGPISGDEQLEDIDFTAIYFIPEQLVDPEGNL